MVSVELKSIPSLEKSYGKALLGSLKKHDTHRLLTDWEYFYSGKEGDSARLSRYDSLCGFRFSDQLPATYPHVLAFPIQMSLLTDKDFPFSVLGLVHISNRITQRRALRLNQPFTVKVRATQLREHGKGEQFDIVTEFFTSDIKDPQWTEVSTYLHRAGKSESARQHKKDLEAVMPTAVWQIPADIGRAYAEVSGDRNPIHLHTLTARMFGFRSAIAHGMWTKARCLAAFEGRIPEQCAIFTQFTSPVLLPAKAIFHSKHADAGWSYELRNSAQTKTYLTGDISVSD